MGEVLMVRRDGDPAIHLAQRAPGVLVVYPPECGARASGWEWIPREELLPEGVELCRACLHVAALAEQRAPRAVLAMRGEGG